MSTKNNMTIVDKYWNEHTVAEQHIKEIKTATELDRFLEFRFKKYPLAKEFLGLYGDYEGKVVVDYGCGPGFDVIGFARESGARKVIGVDVSKKALEVAEWFVKLSGARQHSGVQLVPTQDTKPQMPLPANLADHILCNGVLHHTSDAAAVLRDFHRVLKPNSTATIMMYNRQSIFYHLYVAYHQRFVYKPAEYGRLSVDEVFTMSTDGEHCPISYASFPEDVVKMCEAAGFVDVEYKGGYLSSIDSADYFAKSQTNARLCEDLEEEHKEFIRHVCFRDDIPYFEEQVCGSGGVFQLHKH